MKRTQLFVPGILTAVLLIFVPAVYPDLPGWDFPPAINGYETEDDPQYNGLVQLLAAAMNSIPFWIAFLLDKNISLPRGDIPFGILAFPTSILLRC